MRTLRLGSLVLPVIGGLIWGVVTYQDVRARTFDHAMANAALVRQYAERLVQTQTIMHEAASAYARGAVETEAVRSLGFHAFLAGIERAQAFTRGLAVIALDGQLLASSRSYPVEMRFGPREYLDAVAQGQTLVVDRLVLEPSGEDAIVVVQPFRAGEVDAAIASAVAIDAIRDFLSGVAARPGEAAALLREDGKLLVRHVPSPPLTLDPNSPQLIAIGNRASGTYQARAAADGVERLYAFSKIDDLPIYAIFGTPLRLVWQDWLTRAAPVWLLLIAGGLFSFVLSGFAQRSMQARLENEEQARLREAAEARAEQQQHFMRELNHRVKNNLALIDSLISIQLRKSGQVDAHDLRTRIAAIADVHELLYRAADAKTLDLGELLAKLCRSPALIPAEHGITLDMRMEPGIETCASRATSLALAVVELVTNAVKYAFPERAGTLTVALRRDGSDLELVVADDGVGMPPDSDRRSGIRIVEALVGQIGGTVTRQDGPGTRYVIRFAAAH